MKFFIGSEGRSNAKIKFFVGSEGRSNAKIKFLIGSEGRSNAKIKFLIGPEGRSNAKMKFLIGPEGRSNAKMKFFIGPEGRSNAKIKFLVGSEGRSNAKKFFLMFFGCAPQKASVSSLSLQWGMQKLGAPPPFPAALCPLFVENLPNFLVGLRELVFAQFNEALRLFQLFAHRVEIELIVFHACNNLF